MVNTEEAVPLRSRRTLVEERTYHRGDRRANRASGEGQGRPVPFAPQLPADHAPGIP